MAMDEVRMMTLRERERGREREREITIRLAAKGHKIKLPKHTRIFSLVLTKMKGKLSGGQCPHLKPRLVLPLSKWNRPLD